MFETAYQQPAICIDCKKAFSYDQKRDGRRRKCDECKKLKANTNPERCEKYRELSQYMTSGVHITKAQKEFIDKNFINLSKFVRIKLDELIFNYDVRGISNGTHKRT